MTRDQMQAVLTEYLAKYRAWSYSMLVQRIELDQKQHQCLEHFTCEADDGTVFQMEFQAVWDDKRGGDVRVIGSLSAEPQKRLFGFLPIYIPDVTDSFIMASSGQFVGES